MIPDSIHQINCRIAHHQFKIISESSIPFYIPEKIKPFIIDDDRFESGLTIHYVKTFTPFPLIDGDDHRIEYDLSDISGGPGEWDGTIGIELKYCMQSLSVNLKSRTGTWFASDPSRERQYLDSNGFFFIMALLHLLNHGYAFHGVAFDFLNQGIIAIGSSGIGKSTIQRLLCNEVTFYGDDGVLIQNQDHQLYLVPSPFYQYPFDSRQHLYSPISLKLCLLLKQDTITYLEKIEYPKWVLKKQLEMLFHFTPVFKSSLLSKLRHSLDEFMDRIPCYILHFSHVDVKILDVLQDYFQYGIRN